MPLTLVLSPNRGEADEAVRVSLPFRSGKRAVYQLCSIGRADWIVVGYYPSKIRREVDGRTVYDLSSIRARRIKAPRVSRLSIRSGGLPMVYVHETTDQVPEG